MPGLDAQPVDSHVYIFGHLENFLEGNMQLKPPFAISSRLLPALKIGDAWISLEAIGCRDNRLVYRWYIDLPNGEEFSEADLSSPRDDLQEMFATLLDFLSACAEGIAYQTRTGRESENSDLFPAAVGQWATENSDEISILACEIEETPELICEGD